MSDKRIISCHCDAVHVEVKLDDGLKNVHRCDCSLCSRKGYVMASVPLEKLRVVKGTEALSCYQWGTMVAKHYFCSQCGIHTHHQRRSNPNEYGINIACIDGVTPLSYGDIPLGNGNLNIPLAD